MPRAKKAKDSPSVQEVVSHEETPLPTEQESDVQPKPDPTTNRKIEFIIEDF